MTVQGPLPATVEFFNKASVCEGAIPPRPQLANVGGVEHPAPHIEPRVDSARVELRLALMLRSRQELAHRWRQLTVRIRRAYPPGVSSGAPSAGRADSGRRGCAPSR